jgi:hypothetical protein
MMAQLFKRVRQAQLHWLLLLGLLGLALTLGIVAGWISMQTITPLFAPDYPLDYSIWVPLVVR